MFIGGVYSFPYITSGTYFKVETKTNPSNKKGFCENYVSFRVINKHFGGNISQEKTSTSETIHLTCSASVHFVVKNLQLKVTLDFSIVASITGITRNAWPSNSKKQTLFVVFAKQILVFSKT